MKKTVLGESYRIIIYCLFIGIVLGISPTLSFFKRQCQNKYGLFYNQTREKLHIPIIPKNWHIKERDDEFIWWTGEEKVVGHQRKSVVFSGCDIEGELDFYTLPIQKGNRRWLQIEYKYKPKPQKDSIIYTYQIEDSAKEISRKTADSIFQAENMNKNY